MIRVAVIGHTGRLGVPLVKLLEEHPNVNIVYEHSTSDPNEKPLSESEAELVFLALPRGGSEKYLQEIEGKKVIDLSIDHRDEWIYGFPELYREEIKNANLIASPGCYPTAIFSALYPIKDFVNDIKITAYSGVSGRPNQPVIEDGGIERYATGREHLHVKEMEMCLGKQIDSFEPHLVYPLETGIVVKIEAKIDPKADIDSLYEKAFSDEPFIKLVDFQPMEENLSYFREKLSDVVGTNLCNISYEINGDSITIISALDNVIKGGAGQALQIFNVMYGFEETTGLL